MVLFNMCKSQGEAKVPSANRHTLSYKLLCHHSKTKELQLLVVKGKQNCKL